MLIALPALSLSPARATLDPSVVAADARWMVYLDLNVLRQSELGRQLTEIAAQMQPADQTGGLRVDLQKLLATAGSVTAYGTNLTKDPNAMDGTLVLQGTPELRTIAEGLVAEITVSKPESLKELSDMPFESYMLQGGVTIAFPPEPVILISKSKEQIVKARDVVRGSAVSLAQEPSSLSRLLAATGTSYLSAASIVPSVDQMFGENQPHARILRMANSGSLTLGENGEMTSARLQLVASSDSMADKLSKIVQGMAAIVSLAETDDEQLNKFLQSVAVGRTGNTVHLTLSYPTTRLVEMIKSMQQEAAAKAAPAPEKRREKQPEFPDPDAGVLVAQWTADKQLPGDAPTEENMAAYEVDDVALTRGAVLVISGLRNQGENARIDFLESTPMDGSGPSLRYEAEYMRLKNYRVESVPFASGGELVVINGDRGSASFQFQGASGRYHIRIGYVDESDGKSRFALSIKNPELPEAPDPGAGS